MRLAPKQIVAICTTLFIMASAVAQTTAFDFGKRGFEANFARCHGANGTGKSPSPELTIRNAQTKAANSLDAALSGRMHVPLRS